jgi:hypothetical protein
MNELQQLGKRRTILISISILIVSLHNIYFYNSVAGEMETKKMVQQIVRFVLTIGLLVAIYQGKNWARLIAIVLFGIAAVGALAGIITIEKPMVAKVPLMVMTFVFAVAIYHFSFSKSFKAFFEFQQANN